MYAFDCNIERSCPAEGEPPMTRPRAQLPDASDPGREANSGAQLDRWDRGAWLFRDKTLRGLEILLDEAFRIPGTWIRFGIDGIIGLVPGLGAVVSGLLALVFPFLALYR